ncbi:type VI secretion system secreted protein VgrG [Rhodobacter aestuarii]|uniref:Type VI secretion system secreted protein VgrG n=2 Tax=Rhodobacter aestuarii TaxID=453582 RepID=A0A1N7MDC3_9RHOB|nr:type VI secretion system secreted protein VgrG [Rhodobacter aestuarii]SIS83989.1 type VI secretion system secreted protein VgrG [Rhodobacter aestuarii]
MGRLSTVLGQDVLVLQRFSGVERLSDLFDFTVDCLAASSDIDFDALIGTHATVTLETTGGERAFDGIVTEARWLGAGESGQRYSLRLQPWFFLATLRRNQRIFHNKTVVEIVSEVLSDHAAVGAFEVQLSGSYPVLEYTVQFRESDFAFVSRMLERHGISYHFQHVEGAHALVLSDMVESHPNIGPHPYHPDEGHHQEEVEHFWAWRPAQRVTTGAIKLTDYNFKTPNAAMVTHATGDAAYAQGQIESYDWPGDYLDQGRGRVLARLGAQRERGQDRRFEAEGDIPALAAGTRVTLAGDAVPGTGAEYLCLSATHSYTSDNYGTGGTEGDGFAYSGQYVLMPSSAPMLPELKTTRADVRGPQTAKVVGEGEIDCDEYGRILVQFQWDIEAAYSMRCRVSQNWGGSGWGGMVIPRIGMEVLVEFLDGDPDQPLVTGCVYNGANMPPYDLPANKTKAVWRSNTHKGSGFNEISFEDENDREKIYVHAEKDMELHVENNRAKRVDRNQSESVGHNKSVEVGNNHHEVIGGNMTLMVGPNKLQSMVTSAFQKFTGAIGNLTDKLGLPDALNMGEGNLIIGVAKNKAETVMVSSTEIVGAAKASTIGGGYQLSVGGVKNETVAVGSWEEVGQTKVTVVGHKYEIVCGASKLVLERDGTIRLEGKDFKVTQSGSVSMKAGRIDLN